MTQIDPKRRFLCRHIHTAGHRCGSPALRGGKFCYYHDVAHRSNPIAGRTGMFVMSRIDDRDAIQIALYDVLSRVSANDIDYKRAGTLLYGLQIASSNLARRESVAVALPQVEEVEKHFLLGDLAPNVEITDPAADTAAASVSPADCELIPYASFDSAEDDADETGPDFIGEACTPPAGSNGEAPPVPQTWADYEALFPPDSPDTVPHLAAPAPLSRSVPLTLPALHAAVSRHSSRRRTRPPRLP